MINRNAKSFPPWQRAFTPEALRRAWLMVRANQGTAGPDGETVAQFEADLASNLTDLRNELLSQRYRPRRVTQILVPKPGHKWRPLSLWAVRDRIVQRTVHDYLEPVFEQHFSPCSYGFRPGRTTADAAAAIGAARRAGAHWTLDADIKDCFGQMEDRRLQAQLKRWRVPTPICQLVRLWLQAKVWNGWLGNGRAGTSQGGVISPLLCNLYLHPFDEVIAGQREVRLVRYADDFVILARKKATIVQVQELVQTTLKDLNLQLHPQKTRITSFEAGFQFVGWFFVRNERYQLK